MAYEQLPGRGSLFKNEEKKNPAHSDYSGTIKLENGVVFYFSGWKNKKDIDVKLKEKEGSGTGEGSLVKVKEKRNPNSPDYTGSVNVGGQKVDLVGWEKPARSGVMISISVSKPLERKEPVAKEGDWEQPTSKDLDWSGDSIDIGVPVDFDDK